MSRVGALAFAAAILAAVGCGGGVGDEGTATLWVTRDRGAQVLVTKQVSAGLTVLQALREGADVETRYGGRFVLSVEGLRGSAAGRRDWFYFVNGIEADRGGAEYRLRAGDIGWWDYRSWSGRMREPVVVGAFPEPFLHGYAGDRRPAVVRYRGGSVASLARSLGRLVRASSVAGVGARVPDAANLLLVVPGGSDFRATMRSPGARAGAPVRFTVSARAARRLIRNPAVARFRYEGLPE